MIDVVAIVISLLYFTIFLVGFYQFIDVIISNNKKKSQKNLIILLLTCGALLRVTFWIKVSIPTVVDTHVMLLIFFLPLWFNFAGFSTLALFYADSLNIIQQYGQYPTIIAFIANFILLILNIMISTALSDSMITENNKVVAILFTSYATMLDLLLSGILGYLGHHFSQLKHIRNLLPRSIYMFSVVNWVVVLCYLVRGIVTPILLAIPTQYSSIEFNGNHPSTSLVTLFFLLVTEICPNGCIMILLMKLSGTKHLKYQSFTVKQLDMYLNLPTDPSDDEMQDNYLSGQGESLSTALLVDDKSNMEETSHHLYGGNWNSYGGSLPLSFEDVNSPVRETEHAFKSDCIQSENASASLSHQSAEELSYVDVFDGITDPVTPSRDQNETSTIASIFPQHGIPRDHGALAESYGDNPYLPEFHTPSPQIVHVGSSYESSPGSADLMWQQIYQNQNNHPRLSLPNGLVSALYRPTTGLQTTIQAKDQQRDQTTIDPIDRSVPPRRATTPSTYEVAHKDKGKYGNFLSPRDILLMTESRKKIPKK